MALERSAELEGSAIEGMIKITAPRLFTDKFLLHICQKFKALHPKITFSLNCSYTSHDLTKSNYDLAFRATNNPPQNMVAKQLLAYQQSCCASPQYLEKYGTPKSPQELVNHQCLSGPEQSTWPFVTAATDVSGWMEINDNTMLKSLAVNGEGIIRVAQYLVEQEIAQGKLIPILTNFENTASNIYIIHPQFIHQSKRLAAFIEFTKHYFKQRSASH